MIFLSCFLYISNIHAADADGDGVDESIDCNDNNNMIYPNAVELCDQMDNNCNGIIDEGTDRTFWKDGDGDDYGNPEDLQKGCSKPQGYVVNSQDCDDDNPTIHPAQVETCDGIDNNCNSETDEGCAGNEPSYEGVNTNDPSEEEEASEEEQQMEEEGNEEDLLESENPADTKPKNNTSNASFLEVDNGGCGGSKSLILLFPFLLFPFRRKRSYTFIV